MNRPTPNPSSRRSDRVRTLFALAMAQPDAQREAFVRQQAGTDTMLADEVLSLPRRVEVDTFGVAAGARVQLHDSRYGEAADISLRAAADLVQSTATGELMEKLEKAPKLDEQRFAFETEVGKGGMGAVLRIHDQHWHRRASSAGRNAPGNGTSQAAQHQSAQAAEPTNHPTDQQRRKLLIRRRFSSDRCRGIGVPRRRHVGLNASRRRHRDRNPPSQAAVAGVNRERSGNAALRRHARSTRRHVDVLRGHQVLTRCARQHRRHELEVA